MDADRQLAAVVEDAVQRVGGIADGGADHAGREMGVLIADPAVVREAVVAAKVGVLVRIVSPAAISPIAA